MIRFLLDADAVLALRSLSVLDLLLELARQKKLSLSLMEWVRDHELSDLRPFLDGKPELSIERIVKGTPSWDTQRKMRKEGKADKGEIEAIAWATTQKDTKDIRFVSVDSRARHFASANHLTPLDVRDLCCDLVIGGMVEEATMAQRLVPWDERTTGMGKPPDYRGLGRELLHRKR
jgi:hypothetical protein